MKKLINIRFNRYIVLALLLVFMAIMFWPRTCTKVVSTGSTVQEYVYFRGVRGCPSTAEIINPAWYDTPLVDLKL